LARLQPGEGLVGLAQRHLLLLERVVHGPLRLRAADLVDEDAQRDRRREHPDQQRAADDVVLVRDLGDRDQAERRARRGHRKRREYGPAVRSRDLYADRPGVWGSR
jgi:hypothetical protein